MWYNNERIPEEEGVSKLLVGKTFAYFPKYASYEGNENEAINKDGNESVVKEVIESMGDNDSFIKRLSTMGLGLLLNVGQKTEEKMEDTNTNKDNNFIEFNSKNSLLSTFNTMSDNVNNVEDIYETADNIDCIKYNNKVYELINPRLGRTIIPLNPELLAQSTLDKNVADNYLNEIYKTVQKYSILTEYSFLIKEIPRNFYCLIQYDNLYIWDVFFFLYSTIYKNGKFKIQIRLNENYPNSIPEVYFLTPVFHPLINPESGKLNLGIYLNKWSPNTHYMSLVFLYIKSIFYLQDEYSKDIIENKKAYYLLNNNKQKFLKKVNEYIKQSNSKLYEKIDNFMFNFNENTDYTYISNKLESLKNDQLCTKKPEAFIYWFLNNNCHIESVQSDHGTNV
ncbi:ubiquitin-conjugating enzyme E2, putative [Hepatocystis sp. ex Piliocolobus tephrosceles]|uniref:Protein crossbronx homolog n=1 Tax=Piliocolobus tephrosceles TaxID=591936 RepID=A0A8C9I3N4_9PRIM|nr:ubiquitin-conjugating enzyme E2, putative [Hepatocystis sp. ex Piliocolobus tephrosceles]